MAYFRINYKTDQNELFELIIPHAFDFSSSSQEDIELVNTAAQTILTQNAIDTDSKGDLDSIDSIVYHKDNITTYIVEQSN